MILLEFSFVSLFGFVLVEDGRPGQVEHDGGK